MECISCKSSISPKWKFAIDSNSCPCCGEKIMEEELKNLITSLTTCLNALNEKYSHQLDDWMLSNFNYIKTDNSKLIDYVPKNVLDEKLSNIYTSSKKIIDKSEAVKQELEDYSDSEPANQDNVEKANKFFKLADVDKSVKRTEELKKIVQQIKKDPAMAKASYKQHQENDEIEVMDQEIDSLYDEDNNIPPAVLAFSNQGIKHNPNYNPKDMLKLQQLQQRTMQSRQNVINGTGGKGSFSRSG